MTINDIDSESDGVALSARELVFEQKGYKGYSTEFECGWKWELEYDDELYQHGYANSPAMAIYNIESKINLANS